jgi:hypothetical protein
MSKITLTPNASGTGTFTVASPNSNTNRTLTLPDAEGNLVVNTGTGVDITGVLTTDGISTSADINFGDNDKAIFGAGSDLQIYHDGSNSHIKDTAAGNLNISGNDIQILNAASNETMAYFAQDGDVTLYYNGSSKLATTSTGVDITGTLTSDGLTVDGVSTLISNSSADGILLNGRSDNISQFTFRSNDGATNYSQLQSRSTEMFVKTLANIPMSFHTNNTERMRIDSSGVVRIGGQTGTLKLGNDATYYADIEWEYNNNELAFTANNTANFTFNSNGSERMRIDSSGNLLVGKTSASDATDGLWATSGGTLLVTNTDGYVAQFRRNGSDGVVVYFLNDSSSVGTISVSGSSTSYNTSSDYRLKTDAQPMTGASARVQALNPVNFEWIADGTRVDGFLAHEAQAVVPEAVTGTKDAMRDEEYEVTPAVYEDVIIPAVLDDEGNELEAERTEQQLVTEAVMGTRSVPDYQGIDQSKLVPLLTAALQEALTEISDLKARVVALEAV